MCGSKYEDKMTEKKTQVQWRAWAYVVYAGETERERERETKSMFQKMHNLYSTLYTCMCSMNTFIPVLEGLAEVPSYFNAH